MIVFMYQSDVRYNNYTSDVFIFIWKFPDNTLEKSLYIDEGKSFEKLLFMFFYHIYMFQVRNHSSHIRMLYSHILYLD